MQDVDIKLDFYKSNSYKAKQKMEKERKHLWTTIHKFFELLSRDAEFQLQVLQTAIPF